MSHHEEASSSQNPSKSVESRTNQPRRGDDATSTGRVQGGDVVESRSPAKSDTDGTQQSDDAVAAVQQYHDGQIQYADAVRTIVDTLRSDEGAMRDYIDMLEESDTVRQRNEVRGERILGGDGRWSAHPEEEREYHTATVCTSVRRTEGKRPAERYNDAGRVSKRRREDASIIDSDDENSSPSKADATKYAFYRPNGTNDITDPIVRQSLKYKQAYMVEGSTKSAKSYLLTQAINRPSIPDAFWDPILARRYVDLDKLFSSIYAFGVNRAKVGTIGRLELAITEPEPSITKRITNHGEWTIAFRRYYEARVFAFGNEAEQLTKYQDWIERQFTVVHPQHHQRVIDLDKAIRTWAATNDQYRLDDFGSFLHLHTQYVSSVGIGSGGGSGNKSTGTGTQPRGKLQPVCIRWNMGRCNGDRCRFRHVCKSCGSSDHRDTACESNSKEGDVPKAKEGSFGRGSGKGK